MTRRRPILSGSASHIDVTPDRVRPARALGLAVAIVLVLIAVGSAAPTTAHAHPLGNFSINHLSTVSISDDRVDVRYILDQAEVPTVQERSEAPSRLLAQKREEVLRGLELTVDGRRVPLELDGRGRVSFPPGSGGLKTSRFEFRLVAAVDSPRSVRLHDGTFEDRVGWKAIVAEPGEDTAVRTSAPSGDPTGGLRRYPDDVLGSPLDRRDAAFSVRPGDGTLVAPRNEGGWFDTTGDRADGFAGLFERAAAGEGVLLLLLLAAFGWGALHALSPGHGKAMVAAYLVGTHGRPRHAIALGATVTVTHTIGVFALGLVTLALSQYVLPEDLYPWLNLTSGLLVVVIGAAVLRSRIRAGRRDHRYQHQHHHQHEHHQHQHQHQHQQKHQHHPHRHHGRRHHHHPHHHSVTKRSLLGMGAAAGLIPCPSALVVLLAAVSQHEIALGMLLIVAFSFGLAGTLTALGLAVVYARRLVPRGRLPRLATALPAVSALLIVGVGCVLTANAVPDVFL
jgi:nickel/cobalt transporter (NicO) family protein